MSETRVLADVKVRIDDRVRLIGALLAMTSYPNDIQRIRPHGTHIHARNTRRTLGDLSADPAVMQAQAMLDAKTPLETFFTLAMHLHPETLEVVRPLPGWVPADWATNLKGFSKRTHLSLWFDK